MTPREPACPVSRPWGKPALLAAIALLLAHPAQAQRAASSPSIEDAATAAATPPPPPGFPSALPGILGRDIVYGGEIESHTQTDFVSSTGQKTHVSLFSDTDVTGFVNYRGWLSLNTEAKLERNRDDNNNSYFVDRNAAFRSEGITLRQLFATVRPLPGLSVYGGKIHPGFGSAYEQAPGQFYNFGNDYEQDERIGFGAQYALSIPGTDRPELARLGLDSLRIAIETFYLDTSDLSRSFLSTPGIADPTADRLRRYSRDQFGASNTGSLDSGTISIRGGRGETGLAWQASLTREATKAPGGRAEFGQSIGASYDPGGDGNPLGPRLGVTPYLEYAHFSNFQGIAGLERHYAVGGAAFTLARWGLSVAAGIRRSQGVVVGTDHQENVSLTYQVIPRLSVGVGINFINVDGKSSRALSPAINYKRAF